MIPFKYRWKWFIDPCNGSNPITRILVLVGLQESYSLENYYIQMRKRELNIVDPIEEFNHGKITL